MNGGSGTRQWMLWAFKIRGCVDCGWQPSSKTELRLIHCDHRNPAEKTDARYYGLVSGGGSVSNQARSGTHDAFLVELAKCDPVCEDCHKRRTRERGRAARSLGELSKEGWAWLQDGADQLRIDISALSEPTGAA